MIEIMIKLENHLHFFITVSCLVRLQLSNFLDYTPSQSETEYP